MKTYSFNLVKDGELVGNYEIDHENLNDAVQGLRSTLKYLQTKHEGEYKITLIEHEWECISQTPFIIQVREGE